MSLGIKRIRSNLTLVYSMLTALPYTLIALPHEDKVAVIQTALFAVTYTLVDT